VNVCEHVIDRRTAVDAAAREREAGARRRERLEPEALENARGAGVPWIRDDEGLAAVERPEVGGLLCLRRAQRGCGTIRM
jgi:hypothetical protein